MTKWWSELKFNKVTIHESLGVPALVEKAVAMDLGKLSKDGALVFNTGKFTGRAANDKYVVQDSYSTRIIDWSGNLSPMDRMQYSKLKKAYLKQMKKTSELFVEEKSVGADPRYNLGVRLVTPNPVQALFVNNMFRPAQDQYALGTFTIYHAPELNLDPEAYGLKSSTAIVINFKAREILIVGTLYSGEIKKAVFSVMNTLLPDHHILPMHAGANVDERGISSVFFGLSGTGKTTLSTDVGKKLVGDDEIGFSKDGIFNLEGGCYAKTYNLSEKSEPQIYDATNHFGSLLENVVMDDATRTPDFNDKSITENGRSSYPLSFIADAVESGQAAAPHNIFFLSADATGVLPPVSLLDEEQIKFYFLSGYTAKLGGTELGVSGVQMAFSHCFGAPFMMRRPQEYAYLLLKLIKRSNVKVWLINTGWSGGSYGVGERFSIEVTRGVIRAIQAGVLTEKSKFIKEPYFNLSIPLEVKGIDSKVLDPLQLWKSRVEYAEAATKLKKELDKNYLKFK